MKEEKRNKSSLVKETYALVLAGGRGSRLFELTDKRSKPSVFFGGKHRIIDFPLSNCINSGLRRIGVATQYRSHSLISHLQRGWGHFRRELGEYVEILPASQQNDSNWYVGTADAVYQNAKIITSANPERVLVLSGDHVYRMDYGEIISEHVEKDAHMTVACIEVPVSEAAGAFGVLTVDENKRVIKFTEKPEVPDEIPGKPGICLASMGNYVFNTDFLLKELELDAISNDSQHDFGNDIIPKIINTHNIYAFSFQDPYHSENPYWRDVGTIDSFWEANMDLVSTTPQLDLYDKKWPIWTYQEQLPPAKFVFNSEDRRGMAVDSTVSSGCIISGAYLERSLLFSRVTVNSYSKVTNTVVLPEVFISRNSKIHNAVIDRGVIIPEGTVIGYDEEQDRLNGFRRSAKGIVLVTQEMVDNMPPQDVVPS